MGDQLAYRFTYDRWIESIGIPVHRGYFVPDGGTVELGWWEERGCNAAFIQLEGQQCICETRITEIAPGQSLPRLRLGVDEMVYVIQGQGLASVWSEDGSRRTFEWQPSSLFRLPAHCEHQLSNARGDQPVRLLHHNYLPWAMSVVPDPDFFFNNSHGKPVDLFVKQSDYYSATGLRKEEHSETWAPAHGRPYWSGNFFPDLLAWDKMDPNERRGAGGATVDIQFPGSELTCHMSAFAPRTYKKAHRHGPGVMLIVVAGEGYSIMWPEGQERVVIPWRRGSMLVPPGRWYHQHFNAGAGAARYLALHAPLPLAYMRLMMLNSEPRDRDKDQIQYCDEDPWIRAHFEEELAKRGLTSLVPEGAYADRNFAWKAVA